jgi:multicomponent Na+:H+ antiporter subunit B
MVLLTLLAATLIGVALSRRMFGVVVMMAIFSFLMATVMVVLDAVDVAMTEAAVGAGISTVLLLGTLHLTKSREIAPGRNVLVPLFVAGVTGAALVFGTLDLPPFGGADTPPQTQGPDYLDRTKEEIGIPNVVTAVLASYRGFDTLGEVAVIFTGGIGVLILLHRRRRREADDEEEA